VPIKAAHFSYKIRIKIFLHLTVRQCFGMSFKATENPLDNGANAPKIDDETCPCPCFKSFCIGNATYTYTNIH